MNAVCEHRLSSENLLSDFDNVINSIPYSEEMNTEVFGGKEVCIWNGSGKNVQRERPKKKRNNSQQIERRTRRELENRVKGIWEFFVPFL